MNPSLLVIGHGSRSEDAVNTFKETIELMKQKNAYPHVLGAHMELSKPDVYEVAEELNNLGVRDVIIVPYFLYEGMHLKEDIPGIIETISEKYPEMNFIMAKPIGFEPILADILIKRAEEAC